MFRNEEPVVFSEVALHSDVYIWVEFEKPGVESASVCFGRDGRFRVTCANVDDLERLATVAADGARQLRERIAALGGGGHAGD